MRGLALSLGAILMSVAPAQAAWKYYVCPSDNFAIQSLGPLKMENVKYSMPRHGAALSARTYTATIDNIAYRMLVADYSDRIPDGASILEEAVFQHTDSDDHGLRNGKLLSNGSSRIENPARGATYGRVVNMDMPNNGGRDLTSFFFRDGKLYEQSALILPANGDYTSPNSIRFVESTLFNLSRLNDETGGNHEFIPGCGTTIKPFTYK